MGILIKATKVVGAVTLAVALTSCATSPKLHSAPTPEVSVNTDPAVISIAAVTSSLEKLDPGDQLKIDVQNGQNTVVKVSDKDGHELPGKLADNIWEPEGNFAPRQSYTVEVTTDGNDGNKATTTATATTPNPEYVVEVDYRYTQGAGNGMPVWVRFDMPVKDQAQRKAIMDTATIKTVPEQEGSWGWMDEQTLYWRPKEYWQPGSTAHVEVNAAGLPVGDTWVLANTAADYSYGDLRVIKADINGHSISMFTNGQQVQRFDASFGKPGDETKTGTKLIMEKQPVTVMDSTTFGLPANSPGGYRTNVQLAQRITWSGEYIHAAPWADYAHGSANVSHGCTGLTNANAQWLYNWTHIGDPVEYTGNTPKVEAWDTYGAWSFSWEEWQKFQDGTLAAPTYA